MPRYYFNLFDGSDMFDEEGTELSGVKEMRLYMLTMALEVMKKEENWKETWQMEALDEQGKIIGTLDFGLDQRLSKRS